MRWKAGLVRRGEDCTRAVGLTRKAGVRAQTDLKMVARQVVWRRFT
jgi:hypothetical protein